MPDRERVIRAIIAELLVERRKFVEGVASLAERKIKARLKEEMDVGGTWKHGGQWTDDQLCTLGTGGETASMKVSASPLYSEARLEELASEPVENEPLSVYEVKKKLGFLKRRTLPRHRLG